jgi:hypothetical protein
MFHPHDLMLGILDSIDEPVLRMQRNYIRPSLAILYIYTLYNVQWFLKEHQVFLQPGHQEFWTDESAVEVLYLSNTKSHWVQEADLGCAQKAKPADS